MKISWKQQADWMFWAKVFIHWESIRGEAPSKKIVLIYIYCWGGLVHTDLSPGKIQNKQTTTKKKPGNLTINV